MTINVREKKRISFDNGNVGKKKENDYYEGFLNKESSIIIYGYDHSKRTINDFLKEQFETKLCEYIETKTSKEIERNVKFYNEIIFFFNHIELLSEQEYQSLNEILPDNLMNIYHIKKELFFHIENERNELCISLFQKMENKEYEVLKEFHNQGCYLNYLYRFEKLLYFKNVKEKYNITSLEQLFTLFKNRQIIKVIYGNYDNDLDTFVYIDFKNDKINCKQITKEISQILKKNDGCVGFLFIDKQLVNIEI